jgi:hypothetical protein
MDAASLQAALTRGDALPPKVLRVSPTTTPFLSVSHLRTLLHCMCRYLSAAKSLLPADRLSALFASAEVKRVLLALPKDEQWKLKAIILNMARFV